jgi:hypothetical protein
VRDGCGGVQWSGQAPLKGLPSIESTSMADEDRTRDRTASNGAGPRKKNTEERPFDLWLHKQLHAMYDEIASEPLPTDLLKLIDNDAAKADEPRADSVAEPRNKK